MSPLGFNKAEKIQGFQGLVFYATIRKQMQPGDSSPQDSTARVLCVSDLDGALDRKIMTT